MRWPQSTGHFAQRGQRAQKANALAKSRWSRWLICPILQRGSIPPCQIPNSGAWRLSGRHSRICQGNKWGVWTRATQIIPVQRIRKTGDSAGSLMEYYACLGLWSVDLRAKANPNNRHIIGAWHARPIKGELSPSQALRDSSGNPPKEDSY